jgi:N-acetyltransferase 10
VAQALTLFVKVIRKISKLFVDIQKAAIRASIPEVAVAPTSRVVGERNAKTDWTPIGTSLDEELTQAGNGATNALREKQREMIDSLDLNK